MKFLRFLLIMLMFEVFFVCYTLPLSHNKSYQAIEKEDHGKFLPKLKNNKNLHYDKRSHQSLSMKDAPENNLEDNSESNYDDLYSDEDTTDDQIENLSKNSESDKNDVIGAIEIIHASKKDSSDKVTGTSGHGNITLFTIWIILGTALFLILVIGCILVRLFLCECSCSEKDNKEDTYFRYMDSFASFDKMSFGKRDSEPTTPVIETASSLANKAPTFSTFRSTSVEYSNEKKDPESSQQNTAKRSKPKKTLSFKDEKSSSPGIKEHVFQFSFGNSRNINIKINTTVVLENTTL